VKNHAEESAKADSSARRELSELSANLRLSVVRGTAVDVLIAGLFRLWIVFENRQSKVDGRFTRLLSCV
jgi:hypothetical protein